MLRKKLKIDDNNVNNTKVMSPETNYCSKSDKISNHFPKLTWQQIHDIECNMIEELKVLTFSNPVAAVYNPLIYASDLHLAYLKKFLKNSVDILFIGMNPGPWGQCQTGIPFGNINYVRDWMKLEGDVNKPDNELQSRPVTGLNCDKIEQSGKRFWGLFESICGDADNFFQHCFVHNLCPLAFFRSSGNNITPAELKGEEKRKLEEICNKYLTLAIHIISPKIIISIGRYTESCVKGLAKKKLINSNIILKQIQHPSPRSLNNTNWNEKAKEWLTENDIMKYLTNSELKN